MSENVLNKVKVNRFPKMRDERWYCDFSPGIVSDNNRSCVGQNGNIPDMFD